MNNKTIKHLIIAWLIMIIALIVDMITTVKGLKLGAIEVNPISAFFFTTFGNMGYIYQLFFGGIVFFVILFFLIKFCSWSYEKMQKRKMSDNYKIFLYYLFAGVFVLLELWIIWHNIKIVGGLT